MHRKQVRAAARTAAVGGTLVLGLGTAPAAMAQPPVTVNVACYPAAIAAAIAGATSGETIVLAPGCVYRLAQVLPDVTVDLTIVGFDTELLRDRGAPNFSLLTVAGSMIGCCGGGVVHNGDLSTVDLTVVNVDFKNGGGPGDNHGGAIYADDGTDLTVQGGIFTGNYSDEYGGAIESDGILAVTGAYFIGNHAGDYGGAVYSDGDATVYGSTFRKNTTHDDDGGAVYNDGDMQLAGSTFTGNSSVYGGAVSNGDDILVMNRDTLTGNTAYEGGGIYNDRELTVYGSLIDFNRASDEGGGIYNDGCGSFTLTHSAVYGNVPDNIFDEGGGC